MNERKDIPILFSAPMVRAILEDRKTVTRRIEKRPRLAKVKTGDRLWVRETFYPDNTFTGNYEESGFDGTEESKRRAEREWLSDVHYRATFDPHTFEEQPTWRPSIFMPRWASRITLEATEDARLEPLQDITNVEAKREGAKRICDCCGNSDSHEAHWICEADYEPKVSHKVGFVRLWDSLHAKDAPWSSNPSVVRLAFRRVDL